MLLSICRICIQVQFDVSAPGSPPHLCVMFWHRECRELECGAPAALGEGAFAGTRLVRRFRPMDEPERGGRWLMSILCKPSATEIEAIENFARIDFARPPVHWGVEYNNLCVGAWRRPEKNGPGCLHLPPRPEMLENDPHRNTYAPRALHYTVWRGRHDHVKTRTRSCSIHARGPRGLQTGETSDSHGNVNRHAAPARATQRRVTS